MNCATFKRLFGSISNRMDDASIDMIEEPSDLAAKRLALWSSLRADALAHVPLEKRAPDYRGDAGLVVAQFFKSAGFRCALLYRLSHTLRMRLPLAGVAASRLLCWFGRHWYGCSIASTARIGGGLILPHPLGIIIGGDVIIGERAWIFQHVTIGGAPEKRGMPAIGDDARIFAGAVLSGPIEIGNSVRVGANAVVTMDVADFSQVRSVTSAITTL